MTWDRVKSIAIGTAVVMVLVTHAPPVVIDPLTNAVAQMRSKYAPPEPEPANVDLTMKDVSNTLKKMLKN